MPAALPQKQHRPSLELSFRTAFALALLLSLPARPTTHAAPALTFSSGIDAYQTDACTVGWSFLVTSPILVTALGYYDANANGLGSSHEVGLWSADQRLLATVTVPAGTGASLVSGFRYSGLAPLLLDVGTYYVGGLLIPVGSVGSPGNDPVALDVQGLATGAEITYDSRRYALGNQLEFPATVGFSTNGYFGGNFQYAVVPEPSPTALLFLGVAYGAYRWTRKQRVKQGSV